MRSPRRIFLGLIFLVFAFASCHKDEPANPTSSTSTSINKVSMQLDGITYTATSVTAIDTAGNFLMTGIINNDTAIYFTAKSGAKVGSYNIADDAAGVTFVAGGAYTATSGTVVVSQVTGTTIAGTFNFITTNAAGDTTAVVTNGTYQTSYTTK
jgi:hypothetical protein